MNYKGDFLAWRTGVVAIIRVVLLKVLIVRSQAGTALAISIVIHVIKLSNEVVVTLLSIVWVYTKWFSQAQRSMISGLRMISIYPQILFVPAGVLLLLRLIIIIVIVVLLVMLVLALEVIYFFVSWRIWLIQTA